MAPGVGSLPPGGEVDIVGPIARYVAGLPPRAVQQVRWALRVFEWLPFPWRFSRASLEAREEFLRRLDRSGAGWHQDLLLLLKVLTGLGYGRAPEVTSKLGYAMTCAVAGPPPVPPAEASPLGELVPPR
jgi:hypothetical protein